MFNQNQIMTNQELCGLFDRIEKAVLSVNCGVTTLESIASEFGLIMTERGQYIHPRWGWPIEFDESVGYYLCY